MKKLSIKEKAKAYDEAIDKAKKELDACGSQDCDAARQIFRLFSELKESEDEDERIRKGIIKYLEQSQFGEEYYCVDDDIVRDYIAWLEKQGNIDKASCEIAEKEKYDFVSGQFIECRKSFNEFKEGNSYWFEYVGNDTYIGRSDNVLNKKFHITPRQLYRLFTQQHSPKENNVVNEGTNVPTAYGKYVDECLNEAAKHFFSEGEDKYSVADLFYAGVRCGQSWLENKGQTFTKKGVDDTYLAGVRDAKQELEKQGEQKPADKVKPKFHEKDWSIDDYLWQITAKEQLDVLYTKIKEAGYEWNAEKKELKKISQRIISAEAKEAMYGKPTAWSEEDELKRSTLIHVVKKLQGSAIFEGLLPEELIAWLKSLKQRIKL